jgi:hypothetical protein
MQISSERYPPKPKVLKTKRYFCDYFLKCFLILAYCYYANTAKATIIEEIAKLEQQLNTHE